VDDIIMPGAFTKTIGERVAAGRVKYIDQHNYNSTRNLWGKILEAREDPLSAVKGQALDVAKEEGATHLLWSKFHVVRVQDAQDALIKIDDGTLDGLSIGYKTTRVEYQSDDEDDDDPLWAWFMGEGTRKLMEVAWWETSSVIWGANIAALTIDGTVKEMRVVAKKLLVKGASVSDAAVKEALEALGPMLQQLRVHPDEFRSAPNAARAVEFVKRFEGVLFKMEAGKFGDSSARDKLSSAFDEFKRRHRDVEKARNMFVAAATAVANGKEVPQDALPPAGVEEEGTNNGGTSESGTDAAPSTTSDASTTTGDNAAGTQDTPPPPAPPEEGTGTDAGAGDAAGEGTGGEGGEGTTDHPEGDDGSSSDGADGGSGSDQPNDAASDADEDEDVLALELASLELMQLELTTT
jgi:hypothetical protein